MANQQQRPGNIIVSDLISLGLVNLDIHNNEGLQPLHTAVKKQKYRLAELLLENGAKVDAKTENNETALSIAIIELLPDIVRLLLEHNADLRNVCKDGSNALWLATTLQVTEESDWVKRAIILDMIFQNSIKSMHNLIELKEMKARVIAVNPRIAVYDLLFMRRNCLVRYAANENLKRTFAECNNDFQFKFPYFGKILNLFIQRGKKRYEFMILAKENLQIVIGKTLPGICGDKILKYLDDAQPNEIVNSKLVKK